MCDCDRPDASTTTIRRARKEHRCCECNAAIHPGETYEYRSGVWDGHGMDFKTCVECADLRRDYILALTSPTDCPPCLGGLMEAIAESGGIEAWR